MDVPERRRRPWTVRLGVLLLVAGVGLAGWVGWEVLGTNYVSSRKHEAIVDEITREWSAGRDSIKAEGAEVSYVVRIPRFGKRYAVPILRGTTPKVLAAGFGRFRTSPPVGEPGNFAIAAHRVTHGEPLRRMPELRPGDEIIISSRTTSYVYVLDTAGDALSVDFSDNWVLAPRPVNPVGPVQPPDSAGDRLLTITTCAELFHTDNRLVAFGHLDRVEPRK